MNEGYQKNDTKVSLTCEFDEELLLSCMRRFLYIRCYSSSDFLAALKVPPTVFKSYILDALLVYVLFFFLS